MRRFSQFKILVMTSLRNLGESLSTIKIRSDLWTPCYACKKSIISSTETDVCKGKGNFHKMANDTVNSNPTPSMNNSSAELTKAERRKIARQKKKEKKAISKKVVKSNNKPKLTKEERREKYTQKFKDKRDKTIMSKRSKGMICFHCRKSGHSAAECPDNNDDENRICYKCGSTEHRLAQCPKLSNKKYNLSKENLPFARCFICNQKGHLSGQCSMNEHGIYPKGGECKNCGSKSHLSLDCPELKKKSKHDSVEEVIGDVEESSDFAVGGGDAQPMNQATNETKGIEKRRKNRVVNF